VVVAEVPPVPPVVAVAVPVDETDPVASLVPVGPVVPLDASVPPGPLPPELEQAPSVADAARAPKAANRRSVIVRMEVLLSERLHQIQLRRPAKSKPGRGTRPSPDVPTGRLTPVNLPDRR
jgi:hypothetical protein